MRWSRQIGVHYFDPGIEFQKLWQNSALNYVRFQIGVLLYPASLPQSNRNALHQRTSLHSILRLE